MEAEPAPQHAAWLTYFLCTPSKLTPGNDSHAAEAQTRPSPWAELDKPQGCVCTSHVLLAQTGLGQDLPDRGIQLLLPAGFCPQPAAALVERD